SQVRATTGRGLRGDWAKARDTGPCRSHGPRQESGAPATEGRYASPCGASGGSSGQDVVKPWSAGTTLPRATERSEAITVPSAPTVEMHKGKVSASSSAHSTSAIGVPSTGSVRGVAPPPEPVVVTTLVSRT